MGVAGPKVLASERDATTQDFVMVDNPTFFLRGAVEYARFSELLLKAKGKEPSSLFSALGLVMSGPAGRLTLLLLSLFHGWPLTSWRLFRFANKRIANPVTTRYWSTTPYKFGDTCMKFSAVPAEFPGGPPAERPGDDSYDALAEFLRPAVAAPPVTTPPKEGSPNYLREALARTLALRGAVFLFQVQLFKDDKTTPIDDPTVKWPEDAAPFHTVGRIWIPKQVFDTPGRMAFGENLSFTPWHAILAHEPLGEINAVRKAVYSKLSALRHRLNGVPEREPIATDPDPAGLPPRWGVDASAFCHVLEDELDLIWQRRRHVEGPSADGGDRASIDRPPQPARVSTPSLPEFDHPSRQARRDVDSLTRQVRLRALNEHTTGLALAGQGARGATFAVGFLQGLASLGLIRRLDYLSAVSGGGHAAAWLAAWLKREGGDPENIERQLAPSRIEQARAVRQYLAPGEIVDDEPQPLRHLRSHTGSLDPRAAMFATDAWTTIVSWARNVVIHLLVLLPLFALIGTGARFVVSLYGPLNHLAQIDQRAAQFDSRLGGAVFVSGVVALGLMFLGGAFALGLAFSAIAGSLRELRGAARELRVEPDPGDPVTLLNRRIVTRLLAAALLFSLCLPPIGRGLRELVGNLSFLPDSGGLFSVRTIANVVLAHVTLLGWPNFLAHALIIGGLLAWWTSRRATGEEAPRRKAIRGASFAAGVTGGALDRAPRGARSLVRAARAAGPGGDVRPRARAPDRGGWDGRGGRRAGARRGRCGARVVGRCQRPPDETSDLLDRRDGDDSLSPRRRVRGRRLHTSGARGGVARRGGFRRASGPASAEGGPRRTPRWLAWLASVSAQVFFAGVLAATALFVSLFANMPALTAPGGDDDGPFAYYLRGIEGTSMLTLLLFAIGLRDPVRPGSTADRCQPFLARCLGRRAARALVPGRLTADRGLAAAVVATARRARERRRPSLADPARTRAPAPRPGPLDRNGPSGRSRALRPLHRPEERQRPHLLGAAPAHLHDPKHRQTQLDRPACPRRRFVCPLAALLRVAKYRLRADREFEARRRS